MKAAGLPHGRGIPLCAALILFALGADESAYAATAFVKSTTNRAWATTASATFSGNVTAGNVIAVFVGSYPKAPTLTSVTATCVTRNEVALTNRLARLPDTEYVVALNGRCRPARRLRLAAGRHRARPAVEAGRSHVSLTSR